MGDGVRRWVVTGTPGRPWNGYPSIVMDNEPAPGDFEEVAIVQAVGSGTHADMPHVLNGLQEQAASLGCNYVIRVHVDQGATISSATGVAGRSRQQPRRPGMPMIAKDNDED